MADLRVAGVMAWVGLLYIGYALLRATMRVLIGKERPNRYMQLLGLHYGAGWDARYGILSISAPYEPHVARVISKVMREGDSIFIDVGAYTGFHTLKAYRILRRRHGSLIVAVEPVPQNYQALVRELPKADNIRTVRLAVWTCDDEDIEFYTGKGELSQAGSMTPIIDHMARGYLSDGTIKVRTIRLDTLVRRMGLSGVDLVKMDIESAECHVLTDPTLDLSSVRNLVVEVHYTPMSRESLEIVPSLNKEGLSRVYSTARARWHNYHLIATRYGEIPW